MTDFRFIHAADLHLDSPFKGLNGLPDARRKQVQQSTFSALDALVELAIAEQVDFVLFAGDVYDLKDRSLRAQLKFRRAMERLVEKGIGAYIIHGNHDPLDGKRARLDWPDGVHFFPADQVQTITTHNRHGQAIASIEGISYKTAAVKESLVPFFTKTARPGHEQLYRIGMLHCNVDGNLNHDNYAPCTLDQLIETGIDYWALGHIHTHQVLHREPWIVYSGCAQGRHMQETGAKGCCVVSVSAGKTDVRFQPLDQIRWHHASIDISPLTTDQDVYDAALSAIGQARELAEGRHVMLRLTWSGRGNIHSRLQSSAFCDELLSELREEASSIAVNDSWVWIESFHVRTGVELDLQSLRQEEHFLGDLLRIADQLIADDAQLESFVKEALEPMLTHRKIGKVVRDSLIENREALFTRAQEAALDYLTDGWTEGRERSVMNKGG